MASRADHSRKPALKETEASGANPDALIRRNSPGRRPLNGTIDAQEMSEKTKSNIIAVATREFAVNGYQGASINEIAAKTQTSKRMLYYFFGGKRKLYAAVLEAAYKKARSEHLKRDRDMFEHMEPMEALREYAHDAFRKHMRDPDFVRLVINENLNEVSVLKTSKAILNDSSGNLQTLESIICRGQEAGVMRHGIRPIDVYLTITGMTFYTISNRFSVRAIFGLDACNKEEAAKRQALIGELVCRYVSVHTD
jgi:AcrR family transcriptional regulator